MGRDLDTGLNILGLALTAASILTTVYTRPSSTTKQRRSPAQRASASEVNALGRAVHSEVDGFSREVQLAAAWAVRNRARARRTTIRALLRGTRKAWGRQLGADPPFSSRLPAAERHLVIAREVLTAPQSDDPTNGATSFLEPALYEQQYREGKVKRSLEELRAKWRADGGRQLATVGPIELWH